MVTGKPGREVALHLTPDHDEPFRWKPRYGGPSCILEWLSQNVWRHRLAVYTAVVVTLVLIVQLEGWGR